MSQLMPFEFESHEVRVVLDESGEPWWVAADISRALEYRMASDLTRLIPDDEKGTHEVRTPGGSQVMTMISEPGLYRAVFLARTPKAEPFRRWVTHEVLPSIRKTGAYAVPPASEPQEEMFPPGPKAPLTYVEALQRVIELQQQLLEARAGQAVAHAGAGLDGTDPPSQVWKGTQSVSTPGGSHTVTPPRRPTPRELPWLSTIRAWLEQHPGLTEVTSTQLLVACLGLREPTNVQRSAVGKCMSALGWVRARRRAPGGLHWVYVRP